MKARVSLVATSPATARALSVPLEREGWRVDRYGELVPFLTAFEKRRPAAALIDLSIPGMSGRELLRALRSETENRAVILIALSERHSAKEAVEAFAAGADEYFSFPVDEALLVVRLTSLLRRLPAPPEEQCFRLGPIELHPESRLYVFSDFGNFSSLN